MMAINSKEILRRIQDAPECLLFLDYDGTLAEFAPTPDDIYPDPEVIRLVQALVDAPHISVAVISGRRLAHIQRLVPVEGCIRAGTYGIEYLTPDGERIERVSYARIRPHLERLKQRWQAIIRSQAVGASGGIYLEDKGWALAIHASRVSPQAAIELLAPARQAAEETLPEGLFRILGGFQFLEAGPTIAHKGQTIAHLIEETGLLRSGEGAVCIYLGDDDKDEEAFEIIHRYGGIAVLVGDQRRTSQADFRLATPAEARDWLADSFLNGEHNDGKY